MLLNDVRHTLIDMDGVLWRGDQPLPGLEAFFAALRARDIGVMLLTNNSTRTIGEYVHKLGGFGVEVDPGQVLTSAYATAGWLARKLPPGATVYPVGEDGLRDALARVGLNVVTGEAPDKVDAVAVGLYLGFTYEVLFHATRLIRGGALYVGTNPDVTFPYHDGIGPGAGSLLAAVTAATGQQPTVVGKPNRLMYDEALRRLDASPDQTFMLGDRLDTDILGGQQAGLRTALVMTGVTGPQELASSPVQPTWVFADLVSLTAALDAHA